MAEFKYVVIRVNDTYDYPIIFPDKICHDTMADSARMAITIDLQQSGSKHWKTEVISAGRISFHGVQHMSHGSETLSIKSDDKQAVEDRDMIDNYKYSHGIVM